MKKLFLCIFVLVSFCTMLASCTTKVNNKPSQMAICTVEGCGLEADLDSKYCKEHICGEDNCYELRVEGSAINGYCKEHKCKKEECFNKKTYECELCEEHICISPDCLGEREKGDWCTAHACRFEGCLNGVDMNIEACEEHKCPIENCTNVRDGVSCKEHKCKMNLCNELATNGEYCQVHYKLFGVCGAGIPACTNKPESGSLTCAEHNCAAPGCKSMILKDNLCPDHYIQKNPMIRQ